MQVIRETIHHGKYFNERDIEADKCLTVDEWNAFIDASPYNHSASTANRMAALRELQYRGVGYIGWATYRYELTD